MPVLHRLSPCSPLGAAANQEKESVADVLHRDALRLGSLFGDDKDNFGGGVTIPNIGSPIQNLPGAFEYHVMAGFGTPVQKLTVGFDTVTMGATLLKCAPCAAGKPCDHVFEPSASSSLVQIPCGSPDCPFKGFFGPTCTISISIGDALLGNATFLTDTLTLAPWTTVEKFRFACLEAGFSPNDDSSGILDLSRNSHSLASRAPCPLGTDTFSYCLPSSPNTVGFLSMCGPKPELRGRKAVYTPLRSNPRNGNLYVVELVGLGLGGMDLPIPPPTTIEADTLLEVHTTFTYLRPEVYVVLRDNFRRAMAQYKPAPPVGKLDTCYDFTGLNIFAVPVVTLKFAGGADVELSMDEIMYFANPENHFSVACLAFAAARPGDGQVIGSRTQMSTEVVYDVRGGKVGFCQETRDLYEDARTTLQSSSRVGPRLAKLTRRGDGGIGMTARGGRKEDVELGPCVLCCSSVAVAAIPDRGTCPDFSLAALDPRWRDVSNQLTILVDTITSARGDGGRVGRGNSFTFSVRRQRLQVAGQSRVASAGRPDPVEPHADKGSQNRTGRPNRRPAVAANRVARSQNTPSIDGILHADRLHWHHTSDSIPITGYDYDEFPGTLFYTVPLGYGTPAQQFTVSFDTAAGSSFLRCKPCKAGDSGPCKTAFDPSLSSSFAPIPCGSPECAAGSCSSGQTTCPFTFVAEANGTLLKNTLTFSPSVTVEAFTFGCMESVDPDLFYGLAGLIDLSRSNRSLASRRSNGGDATIALSYCLPSNQSSQGFLSVGSSRSLYSGRRDVQYAPLVENAVLPFFYFVGGTELPIPPSAPISNFTLLDTSTTFSYFVPSVYAVLRDEFRRQMARYPVPPPLEGLDTCYNFTGLNETIFLPIMRLEFAGGYTAADHLTPRGLHEPNQLQNTICRRRHQGEKRKNKILGFPRSNSILYTVGRDIWAAKVIELVVEQVMYFADPANYFSVACLAFGEMDPASAFPASVIGNLAQRSAEMIYDVQGGKLGFAQGSPTPPTPEFQHADLVTPDAFKRGHAGRQQDPRHRDTIAPLEYCLPFPGFSGPALTLHATSLAQRLPPGIPRRPRHPAVGAADQHRLQANRWPLCSLAQAIAQESSVPAYDEMPRRFISTFWAWSIGLDTICLEFLARRSLRHSDNDGVTGGRDARRAGQPDGSLLQLLTPQAASSASAKSFPRATVRSTPVQESCTSLVVHDLLGCRWSATERWGVGRSCSA
ncbi:hypothetical protein HU200_002838 [Digitaria exilis]|uniref:Peptidase A1 domain-containing protein n=1 Tax=Digitaria exilis TaxID=1010633 RepID=A0A835FXC6_9POAL|nr:hypothetical protein HU200_002838 [Digitaria exilis]